MATSRFSRSGGASEVLFVDLGVSGAEGLIAGARPEVRVEHLPTNANPVDAIGFALAGKRDLAAVHILSHGGPGMLQLAGVTVDAASFATRPAMLAHIRAALAEDAEIILYGCSVAEGTSGAAFVARLSELLGCRVVASSTPVGAASLGGDWDLPTSRDLAFSAAARETFQGLLGVATFGVVTTLNTTTTLTSNESGVTISVTKSDGTAMAGVSSGFLDPGVISNTVSYTLTFSTAIDISQFQIGEFENNSNSANYTFTPNTGSVVTLADDSGSISGAIATLNPGDWTGVTSMTVSYAGGTNWRVGLDNIRFTTSGPSTLAAPDLVSTSDTGSSNTDNITNDTTPTFGGSGATSGNSVHVLVDGTTVGTATATAGGAWSFTITSTLSAGTHAITTSHDDGTTDAGPSSALNIVIDSTAPTAIGAPDLLAASDLGISSTDNITSSATQQLSGSATTGDIVSILVGGVTVNNVTAAGNSWSYTHTLANGSYAITVQASDTAGNASTASAALGLTVDTVAPATAGTPDLLASSDSGSSNTDNLTNASTPTISGTGAEANSVVQILVGGATVGATTASGAGAWTFTFSSTLAAGSNVITVQAQDVAGNSGPASGSLTLVVDTTAASLSAPDLATASDTGLSTTDNITSDSTPTFEGSADANATVSVLSDGTTVGTATAGAGGGWSFTFTSTLADGSYAITAVQTDTAGNTSAVSTALNITIDTTAPTTLPLPDLLATSDLGVSNADNITSSPTQQFSGSTATGDIVSILVGGVTANTVTAAGGSWSYTHTLAAGSYAITVQATDAIGNGGPVSAALGIVVDTTAPGTVGAPDLLASSDLGTDSTDNLTSVRTPTLAGDSAVANALVHVLVGGVTVGSTTASGAGAWTFVMTSTLAAGTQIITARTEDIAGNDGPASAALAVVIDTTAPAAPVTLATPDLIASSDDGTSSTDNVTTDATPTFNGTNTTGSALHSLLANGVTVGTFTSDAGGTYNVTASSLTAGSYSITIREQDAAGNTSSDSPALGITISAPVSNDSGGGGGGGSGTSTGVTTTTTTNATTGTATQTKTVQNTSSTTGSAAIVENTNNNGNVVTATLPAFTSITSEGPETAQTATEALTTLVSAVDARNSTGEAGLITGAQSFLNRLASTTTLDVRTIIPTTTSTSLSTPIVISGTSAAAGSTQSEAFVIDVRSLPTGSTLQLDNIEFASIIGSATVNGGTGDNFATGDDSAQFISLGEGDDTLLGGDGADTIGSGTGNDSLDGEGGDDRVFGGEGNDTVIGAAGLDVVYGNQQSDVLYGNLANDTLYGGQDSDTVFGGQDNDVIYGNLAADSLSGQLGEDILYGGQGDDLLYGGDGADLLFGNLGNDALSGGTGDDTLSGGAGIDVLSGGAGDDQLNGGAGDDTLYGGVAGGATGIDVLDGGAGNDALYGGEGVDWIYTGEGSDAIYIEALNGFDVVVDFDSAAGDVIHLATDVNGSGLTSFAAVQAAATDNADGNVEIALGADNYVRIIGLSSAQLSSDMFQFF